MATGQRFEIDTSPAAVQRIVPPSASDRFEGVAFSVTGTTIAVASADTNAVLLFRAKADGRFQDLPYRTIGGSLDYPHDVAFSQCGETELLAVAQRTGGIAIYGKHQSDDDYGPSPICTISGPRSKLEFSDGVAFVPPHNDYVAACNLESGRISFFRRTSRTPIAYDGTPERELTHASVFHPDGLGFSRCGRWLAIANHGRQTVSIFRRRSRLRSGGKLVYGPEPVTVIENPEFRYPHSVAFTPLTNHLVVTNAGANFFNVYEPGRHYFGWRWSQTPVAQVTAYDDDVFREVNSSNAMEGGPKGVAVHGNRLAICSPQIGVKIYSFRERP